MSTLPEQVFTPSVIEAGTVEAVLEDGLLDDETAIATFLDIYRGKSAHTVRAYSQECRRFLLWLRATRSAPSRSMLPDVTVQDINAYLAFLNNPRPFKADLLEEEGFAAQPFRTPLKPASVRRSVTILHSLFNALRNLRATKTQPYCLFNPIVLAHKVTTVPTRDDTTKRALTEIEWAAVLRAIEELPRTSKNDRAHYHRARWLFHLLYLALLRRHEAASLRMGDFQNGPEGWSLSVTGKGSKERSIIVPAKLLAELRIYRLSSGLTSEPHHGETHPAICRIGRNTKGITSQAIYLICRVVFERAASLLKISDPGAAARLLTAAPHWMRHTGITHALERGVDPRYVQAQAGHASLVTTAKYDHQERRAWRSAFDAAWK